MNDEIKKIAALIGYQPKQEERVNALINTFHQEAALLRQRNSRSPRLSSNWTAPSQVSNVLKDVQKPAVSTLQGGVFQAHYVIYAMRREILHYTWKSALCIAMTLFFVLESCVAVLTWFLNYGYDHISQMQIKKAEWKLKIPLISICDYMPCIPVESERFTYKNSNMFYKIK